VLAVIKGSVSDLLGNGGKVGIVREM